MNRNLYRTSLLILAGVLICANDAPPSDKVTVSLPPGTLEVVGGQSYGAGTYAVPREVATTLKARGYDVPIDGQTAGTEAAARGEVAPTAPPTAWVTPTQTGPQTGTPPDPAATANPATAVPPVVTPGAQTGASDQNAANASSDSQEAQKTGDLPDTFPHVDILRENEVRTFEDLSSVADLEQLENIGEARAADIRNALNGEGAKDYPATAYNIDAYDTGAQLPDNFPGVDALRSNGVLTFGDLRNNWANLEGAGLSAEEATLVRTAAAETDQELDGNQNDASTR